MLLIVNYFYAGEEIVDKGKRALVLLHTSDERSLSIDKQAFGALT